MTTVVKKLTLAINGNAYLEAGIGDCREKSVLTDRNMLSCCHMLGAVDLQCSWYLFDSGTAYNAKNTIVDIINAM